MEGKHNMPYIVDIELDFISDYVEHLKDQLNECGIMFKFPPSNDSRTMIYQYNNLMKRLIIPKKRKVHYSNEFNYSSQYHGVVKEIENKLINGESIFPYMSKEIINLNYKDLLLNDWGVYHLHLGSKIDKRNPRFISRTNELLFIRVDEENVYFINIFKHGDWSERRVLECIHDYWPETIRKYQIKAISTVTLDNKTISMMRKNGISSLYNIRNVCYASPGGGYMSSGHSVESVMFSNKLWNNIRLYELYVKENRGLYYTEVSTSTKKNPKSLEFKLVIDDNNFLRALEKNSMIFFRLGKLL